MQPSKAHKANLHPADYVQDGCISMDTNGNCPFLDVDKLCHLVKSYGEDSLSVTCHTFPREWHHFQTRTEETLSIACPEVFDAVWNLPCFLLESECQPLYADITNATQGDEELLYFQIRDWFIALIQDTSLPVETALKAIFYFALDLYEAYQNDTLTEAYFQEYKEHNLLEALKTEIPKNAPPSLQTMEEQNELLLDLSYNYRRQGLYQDYLDPLCQLAEELDLEESLQSLQAFQEVWTSQKTQHRNILAEELYSTCYLPDGDFYSIVLKIQWLGLTYAAYHHAGFLTWLQNGASLPYATFRQIAIVIFRMTGYSEADIEEYLEVSFESIIWEWPYFSLIVGSSFSDFNI